MEIYHHEVPMHSNYDCDVVPTHHHVYFPRQKVHMNGPESNYDAERGVWNVAWEVPGEQAYDTEVPEGAVPLVGLAEDTASELLMKYMRWMDEVETKGAVLVESYGGATVYSPNGVERELRRHFYELANEVLPPLFAKA